MKKIATTLLLLALFTMVGQAQNSPIRSQSPGRITFAVDEGLSAPKNNPYLFSGDKLANGILYAEQIPEERRGLVATSFANDQNLRNMGKDAFFRCVVEAYANHQSLVLSPDMVWLLISQGFARYMNAHAEQLRPQLVGHTGKMDIIVESDVDLLSGQADWPRLLDTFAAQIDSHTKDGIAKTMTANFTTTGQTERIASEITLMETVKSYFEYTVYYVSCGIPTITLTGKPADWQQVLAKTQRLRAYGLEQWTKQLEPILQEFISASAGKPHQAFWQSMVKSVPVGKLKGGGCSREKPTVIDGWLLKLFPDENGQTLDKVPYTKQMPTERVRVGFKYCVLDPAQGTFLSETPMELWAGFVGAEEDIETHTLTPKIGWLVRTADTDDDLLNELQEKNKNNGWGGIDIRVREVPEVLAKLQHIKKLHLDFTESVTLPEWFFELSIDHLSVTGKLSETEKQKIRQHFPEASVR